MINLLKTVWNQEKPLVIAAVVSGVFGLILFLVSLFDDTQILGINRWIKPIKFFLSAAIYLFTVAILLIPLNSGKTFKTIISWGAIITMAFELILITGQAFRGTTSHFNIADPFDAGIYSLMGIMIGLNTLLIAVLLLLYFVIEADLNQTMLWAVRLGILGFLFGSIQGGYMASQTGHSVGGADGGVGLPFVNWSLEYGDLRVAHFIGLHALQIIPVFGLTMDRLFPKGRTALILVILFTSLFLAVFSYLFLQALGGESLVAPLKFLGGVL